MTSPETNGGTEMTLDRLLNISRKRESIDTEWRDAIAALARVHSIREIARVAGASHGTVHRVVRANATEVEDV